MVNRFVKCGLVAYARRSPTKSIAEQGKDAWFIERGKSLDAITISPPHQCRVVGEPADDVAALPAAKIVERLRQIPMIEADQGSIFAASSASINRS